MRKKEERIIASGFIPVIPAIRLRPFIIQLKEGPTTRDLCLTINWPTPCQESDRDRRRALVRELVLKNEVMDVAKFITKEEDLYIDGKKVLRGWESWNGWYWFATEKVEDQLSDLEDGKGTPDTIWFGLVQGI